MNKKGFTLVELLAVIVILALLIVITANTVLPMMNKTKINAMIVYGEKVLDKASAAYIIDSMTNGGSAEYYLIEQLMGQDDYHGVVKVEIVNDKYSYTIDMFDDKEQLGLKRSNINTTTIEGDVDDLVSKAYYDPEVNKKENYDSNRDYQDYIFNLIDFSKLTHNKYINGKGIDSSTKLGNTTDDSKWKSSTFISVESEKSYRFIVNKIATTKIAGYAWYNESKIAIKIDDNLGYYSDDVITSIQNKGYFTITAPSNAKYLRVSFQTDTDNPNYEKTVFLVEG